MSPRSVAPQTPRDLFDFPLPSRWLFALLIGLFRITGLWKYPPRANGDVETMSLLDKVYWLHKTTNPMRRARRGSGLEVYFAKQRDHQWRLPARFSVEAELEISAVGDLINHADLANSQETLYAQVADLVFAADISMANLECPIYPPAAEKFEFSFRTPPMLAYDLASFAAVKGFGDRKFTFMAVACNHSLDFGLSGIESTLATLRDEGILNHGINSQVGDAGRAMIIEKSGFKIGVVSYTFGLNAKHPPPDRPYLVNRLNLNDGIAANDFEQLKRQIRDGQERHVDFFIAHLHWGLEHEFFPTPEQVELAHHLAELGVDAIIGHHPHVLQPEEYYHTKRNPARVVPIFYSLGNLVNYFSAPYLCRSGVAKIQLVKGCAPDGSRHTYVKLARQVTVSQQCDEETGTLRIVPAMDPV